MDILETAYRRAAAVLTAPVSFVEWTTLKVENRTTPDPQSSDDWSPIGLSMRYGKSDYTWDATQKIERRKIESQCFIYAFARRLWSEDIPTLVEEIKLDDDGTIYTSRIGQRLFPDTRPLGSPDVPPTFQNDERVTVKDAPPGEERTWDKAGDTMRFVRRLRGARLAYYFFATRIPLTRKFIEELRKNVRMWVPEILFDDLGYVLQNQSVEGVPNPTTFGEWDPNLVTGQGAGALQVPVLDPITIALHLHELAVSASEDFYSFMTIYEGQPDEQREKAIKRRQKFVLASVIRMVLKNNKTTAHTADYHSSRYLEEFEQQLKYRNEQMERWWRYLGNWCLAKPIDFLSRVHLQYANNNRFSFLLPMLLCVLDANSSLAGQAMLDDLAKQKNWYRHTVMPAGDEEDKLAEYYQIPRKFALAWLEAIKEHAPHLHDTTEAMWKTLGAYSKRFHVRFFVDGAPMDDDPMVAAKKFKASMKEIGIEVPEAGEIIEEWHEIASPGYTARHLKFKKGLRWIRNVELIDLALSLRQFLNDRSGINTLNLARSALDTSAVMVEFAHGTRGKLLNALLKMQPGIVFVAAVLEGIVSTVEYYDAKEKHDLTAMNAAAFKITGAAVTAAGFVAWVAFGISTTPFVVVGLLLMAVGALISLFKDSPLDTFLKFCAFGEDGGGGEIVEGMEEMKKGEYGQHLEVLLNMICRFECEFGDDARELIVTMGWVPQGAQLSYEYRDHWLFGSQPSGWNDPGRPKVEGQTNAIRNTPGFGKGMIELNTRQQFTLKLSTAPYQAKGDNIYPPDFQIHTCFAAQLHLQLGDLKFVVPPQLKVFDRNWGMGPSMTSTLPV